MISLFGRDPTQDAAELAYARVVMQARHPLFFSEYGVPDTVDGRFELICLHAFLFLNRLRAEGAVAERLGQAFFDTMFNDMDRSLREMGTGDLSVGRQVKRMAQAFYGRVRAYEDGIGQADGALEAALARNLFGTVQPAPAAVPAMAAYLRREMAGMRDQGGDALLAGEVAFGPPPAPEMLETVA